VRIFAGRTCHELQKTFLRHDRDKGKLGIQPGKVDRDEWTTNGVESRSIPFDMRHSEQRFSEADFVQYFQEGRVQRIAAEVAVEVMMSFKECYGNAAPGK
jgi:hypothetical protein